MTDPEDLDLRLARGGVAAEQETEESATDVEVRSSLHYYTKHQLSWPCEQGLLMSERGAYAVDTCGGEGEIRDA